MSDKAKPRETTVKPPDSGLRDSGRRETMSTGAQRENWGGRGRYELMSPVVEQLLAEHFEKGSIKYAPRNWELGLPLSSFYSSARRHLGAILLAEDAEDHMVAALWNLHCMVHTREMIRRGRLPAELDDVTHAMEPA